LTRIEPTSQCRLPDFVSKRTKTPRVIISAPLLASIGSFPI
jgi:hypothetical protein